MLDAPFVLLDDARDGGASARLYRAPVRIVTATMPADIRPALEVLRAARDGGLHAAGYLTYEAGAALAARPVATEESENPLLWFGLFDGYATIDDVAALLPDPAGAWTGTPTPMIDRDTYDDRLAHILDLIRAGDIYQANLTFQATVPFEGDALALFARLRTQSRAGYGALIDTGDARFLSLSPELFFALKGSRITCRPMKGTAARGDTPEADARAAAMLASDAKQRAENLMIVDLMRNDLSRIAGDVTVPDLFTVETYPTVHQLTSTITATLKPGHDAIDAIAALFPCGSITGAPKQRAMEIIAEVEQARRGLYTGTIGRIDPDGDAMFNVAIRTLTLAQGEIRMGLGGGIVADSDAQGEWDETRTKGAFVTAGRRRFDLIETMAFDPLEGLARLEAHLARMKASADALGFRFDRHDARNELQAATFRLRDARRIRLLLAASGAIAIEVGPLPPAPVDPVEVAIVTLPVASDDFRLRHKTTDRGFYDEARMAAGTFDVIFETPDGSLTEGSFTSLFAPSGDRLITPPLGNLLPGILRGELLADGRAVEGRVTRDCLTGGFFVGNDVRGLVPAVVTVAKAGVPGL